MNDIDLKKAFGQTPESVKQCVAEALLYGDRRDTMGMYSHKRYKTGRVLLVAVIAALALGTVAFAAVKLGVMGAFTADGMANESAAKGVQPVAHAQDGDAVRFEMTDALYDAAGGTYAISWTMEKQNDGDSLYVIGGGATFGGERGRVRGYSNATEFILPDGITEGMEYGELPPNGSSECSLKFTVLRALATFEKTTETGEKYVEQVNGIWEKGRIPIDGDGYICLPGNADMPYAEGLIATGLFEPADEFTLDFTLKPELLDDSEKVYSGETRFVFDGYEVRLRSVKNTATSVKVEVEYITEEPPARGKDGFETLYCFGFGVPGLESWCANAGGSWSEPVELEDGRCMTLYSFEAVGLFTQPDTLRMTLVTLDEKHEPVYHTDEAIELRFD